MTAIETLPPTLDFDHHSERAAHRRDDLLKVVRPHPVFWTESHGGYWVVTSHELVKRMYGPLA